MRRKPPRDRRKIPTGWEKPLTQDEEEQLIRDIRTSERAARPDSLEHDLLQGERLNILRGMYSLPEIEEKTGISQTAAYVKMRLAREIPPMKDSGWVLPKHSTQANMILELTKKNQELFAAIKADPLVNNEDVSKQQILDFVKRFKYRKFVAAQKEQPEQKTLVLGHGNHPVLNRFVCGDSLDLIGQLPDNSIDAVITSPPYGMQMGLQYPGIREKDYPRWTVAWLNAVYRKLKEHAAVLIVILAGIEDGRVSPYVLRTRTAILDQTEYFEFDRWMWYKPDGPPAGSVNRPRRNHEEIWCLAKSEPFIDLLACGNPKSKRIGMTGSNRFGRYGMNKPRSGTSRVSDVFTARMSEMDPDSKFHPAPFPPTLVNQLIRTVCPRGGTILDPFAGSGTTGLEARKLGVNFYGFDAMQKFVDQANERLANESEPEDDVLTTTAQMEIGIDLYRSVPRVHTNSRRIAEEIVAAVGPILVFGDWICQPESVSGA